MIEENKKPDHIGNIIVFILFGLLFYAGFIAYKSINWNVLKDLESQQLILPTPIPTSNNIASPSAATNSASPRY